MKEKNTEYSNSVITDTGHNLLFELEYDSARYDYVIRKQLSEALVEK